MQKILIEISHQDQVFVEEECTKKGLSLSGFFELLLNDYRKPVMEKIKEVVDVVKEVENTQEKPLKGDSEEIKNQPVKRRKKKSQ